MDKQTESPLQLLKEYEEKLGDGYDALGEIYDKLCKFMGYYRHTLFLELLQELNIPKESAILDLGCGTGRLVEAMFKDGYTDIQGIDASTRMLEIAEETGFYKKLIKGFVTTPENMPKEYKGAFDVLISSGLFLQPNHADAQGYECIPFCLKKGGIAIFTTDEFEGTPKDLEYKVKREAMEKEGKWELIRSFKLVKYRNVTEELRTVKRFSKPRHDIVCIYKIL